jgi:hypothetical protein
MLENSNPRDERDEAGRSKSPRETPVTRPVTDREVPLGTANMQPALHAWLDGDLPESAVRRGDMVRDVEFWQRINAETETRRSMRSPMHLQEAIMRALPEATPSLSEPWWRRSVSITPATMAVAGVGLVVLGMTIQAMRSR